MKNLFNCIYSFRQKMISQKKYEYYLKTKYILRNYLGLIRGVKSGLLGRIKYEGKYRPLILGASTEFLMEQNSAIIMVGDKLSVKDNKYINNKIFPSASTIGTNPHYMLLNPPALSTTRIELGKNARFILSPNSMILSGGYFTVSSEGELRIGENCYIAQEVQINCRTQIQIGKNVLIGYQTIMMDYDGHPIYSVQQNKGDKSYQLGGSTKPIIIGDNVWIGFRSAILKGVKIGCGSIIGAHSCVTSDVPPNSIVAGNPAKIIKENIVWER